MKILITGDFCPINRADINVIDSTNILCEDFQELLKQTDISITNLECPLTNHSKAISKTGPALKAHPNNVKLLKAMSFNMVTLANNHIMDYGSEGLKDTLDILDKNEIDFVGAGKVEDEIDVVYQTKDGLTIAIINVCENEWSTDELNGYRANGFSEINMFYAIKNAKKNADKIIVIHHGGHEMYNLPSPRLKKTLRYFVDCGADVVINHHTHCVGGYEVYEHAPIFYSLGNFIFDKPNQRNSIWNYGMAVSLDCSKQHTSFQTHYFEQFNQKAQVNLVNEDALKYDISELNAVIADDQQVEERFDNFVLQKTKLYASYLEPVRSKYILGLINRGFLPSIWSKRKRFYLKNLITCESHREIVKNILRNETSHS